MAAQDDLRREAGAMKGEAQAIWNDAAEVARSAARQQQDSAAQGIGTFAGALREAARKTDGSTPSRVAESIADGLDRMSSSLKGRDLGSLLRDVENFARSQPLVFFGVAVATGFVAMRFLKSGAPDAAEYGSARGGTHGYARDTDTGYGDEGEVGSGPARGRDSALGDPDSMQRGVGTRAGASRQSHATEFQSDASVMAARDAGAARRVSAQDESPPDQSGPRSDTARAGSAAGGPANVWPETYPVDKDPTRSGSQSGSGR